MLWKHNCLFNLQKYDFILIRLTDYQNLTYANSTIKCIFYNNWLTPQKELKYIISFLVSYWLSLLLHLYLRLRCADLGRQFKLFISIQVYKIHAKENEKSLKPQYFKVKLPFSLYLKAFPTKFVYVAPVLFHYRFARTEFPAIIQVIPYAGIKCSQHGNKWKPSDRS